MIPGFTRAELKQKEKDKQNVSNETPSLFKKSSWAKLLAYKMAFWLREDLTITSTLKEVEKID